MNTLPTLTDKAVVSQLFKNLRKRAFFARQSYKCCTSCACAAMDDDLRPKHRAAAYTTSQCVSDAFPKKSKVMQRALYIGYGSVEEHAEPMTSQEAGDIIAEEARALGLEIEWDGSPTQKIQLIPHGFMDWSRAKRVQRWLSDTPIDSADIVRYNDVDNDAYYILIDADERKAVEEALPCVYPLIFTDLDNGFLAVEC